MSDTTFDDDDFEGDDSNVVRELRKALKAKDKQVKELETRLGEIESAGRQKTIEDVLTESGVPVGIAKFIPKEVVTADEVHSWLEENAELFGLQKANSQDSEEIQAANRMAKIGEVAQAVDAGDILTRISGATTEAELNEVLFGNSAGPVG